MSPSLGIDLTGGIMPCPQCAEKDETIAALQAQLAEQRDVMGALGQTLLGYKDRGSDPDD